MRQKTQRLVGVFLLTAVSSTLGQGTFQNLDFEAANLPAVPSGQTGGFVEASNAIPSWTAYYSTDQTTRILHNSYTLGDVNVSILGPNFASFYPILEGNYSIIIQSGLIASTTRTAAAIAQTGTIPTDSLSLKFLARQVLFGDPTQLAISIGGQPVPYFPLSTTSNYTVYGADISGFAGQTTELRLTSFPTAASPYNYFEIDSIQFSNQPIPEPSVFGLFALGALIFGWRSLHRRRYTRKTYPWPDANTSVQMNANHERSLCRTRFWRHNLLKCNGGRQIRNKNLSEAGRGYTAFWLSNTC